MNVNEASSDTKPSRLLTNRNFVLLWCAYGVSALGDHVSEMALLKTQDALNAEVDITPLMARMTFVFFLPFLLGPLMGALADRVSRRGLMVAADVVRFAIMLTFAVLIEWTRPWGSWGAFAPLLIVGLFAALFSPARSSLLPTLIRPNQLVRANALFSGLGIIATMAAAKIGGTLAQHYAPMVAFRVDALTFAASAALLLFMRLSPGQTSVANLPQKRAEVHNLTAGFRYARSHRHVAELLIIASLVWFCGSLVNSVIPAIVRDVYHGDYVDISNYRALLGLGFILGAVALTILGDALRGEIAVTWGFFGIALSLSLFSLSVFMPAHPKTLAAIGGVSITLAGIFGVSVMAGFNALLQRTVANRFRGRVFGVNDLCCVASLLLATGILGVPTWTRVDRWVGWILLGVAVLVLVAATTSLVVRGRRGVLRPILTLASHLNEFVVRFFWGFRRIGPSRVPRTGPVIVTSNHVSPPDPAFICAAVPYRLISFLIAAEYVHWPGISWLVRILDCIPVRRGTRETSATKQAIRHLQAGKAMGIFIEGGIVAPGVHRPPKDGVALLALKTGAPVIPAHISGVKYREGVIRGLLVRHNARLRFGPPVDLDDLRAAPRNRDTVRAATRRIFASVQALAPVDASASLPSGEPSSKLAEHPA